MTDTEDLIRWRAYELWEQSGRTGGSAAATDFWLRAERDIRQAEAGTAPAVPTDTSQDRLE